MALNDFLEESTLNRRLLLGFATGVGATAIISQMIGLASDDDDDTDHDDDHDDNGTRGSDDDGKVAPLGTVPPDSAEVRIVDDDADAFQPGTISIDVGGKVTFVNLDDDPHTATGVGFDTGIMQPGGQTTITYEQPGVFPYACRLHPVMTGVVEVRDPDAAASASPVASPLAATPVASGITHRVSIVDFSFDPSELNVATGDTVEWTNDGAAPHTATATDQSFDTGVIDPGGNASHTFDKAGAVDYFCAFHPSMTGIVNVS